MSKCKFPPTYPSKKLIKIVVDRGFTLESTDGSHSNYSKEDHPNVVTIKINEKDIPQGTYKNILKQAGISREEFCDIITKKKKVRYRKRTYKI